MRRIRSRKEPEAGVRASAAAVAAPRGPRAEPLADLQGRAGNEVVNRVLDGPIQAKLLVGSVDDPAERQADRVADAVLQRLGEGADADGVPGPGGRAPIGVDPPGAEVTASPRVQRAYRTAVVTKKGGAALHKSDRKKTPTGDAVKVRSGGLFGTGLKVRVRQGETLQVDFDQEPVLGTDLRGQSHRYRLARYGDTTGYVNADNVALRLKQPRPPAHPRPGPPAEAPAAAVEPAALPAAPEAVEPAALPAAPEAVEPAALPAAAAAPELTPEEAKQALAAALQSPDPATNEMFKKWRDTAKAKWKKHAPDAEPPTDEALFSTWSKIAAAFSKQGGLIDRSMPAERGIAFGQSSAFSTGAHIGTGQAGSWEGPRILMGTPEFRSILDDAEVVAESFGGLFVKELQDRPQGAKVAFWSGSPADHVAQENCDVALEKSALARSFDYNTISTWTGGTEAILWASLSNRYAAEVARQWDKFEVHGFIGPGVRDLTVFDAIESKALLNVLGQEHGSAALKKITWHGVKLKKDEKGKNVPDEAASDGQMKYCFVKGTKKHVENAVMGLRERGTSPPGIRASERPTQPGKPVPEWVKKEFLADKSRPPVQKAEDLAHLKKRKQALVAALQSPDPATNELFVTWREVAKTKWKEAAPDAQPPTDEELFATWSNIATAFSKEGGLIDKALASKRGLAVGQSGAFSTGAYIGTGEAASWEDGRIVMGTPEFQSVLDDAEMVAESFAGLFVKELEVLPKGARVAFWSGGGAAKVAQKNCKVALETSALARSFDDNAISAWKGGAEAIVWASLSNRYAGEVARQWDKFEVHGFIGPGVRGLTIFEGIESKAILKVLGQEHGSEALKKITWHGVKLKKGAPDYDVNDGTMVGCFIRGRNKKLVESAVMGLRDR